MRRVLIRGCIEITSAKAAYSYIDDQYIFLIMINQFKRTVSRMKLIAGASGGKMVRELVLLRLVEGALSGFITVKCVPGRLRLGSIALSIEGMPSSVGLSPLGLRGTLPGDE
jgi:hypothetical protein